MNDRQNAKLNMAQRVSDVFKRYGTVYKSIPAMDIAVKTLNSDIANIRDTQKESVMVNLPASTLEKREAERKMIESCVKTANALYVIGFTTDNKELITLNGLSDGNFYKVSDNAALALARKILDLARQFAGELKDYGIDESGIDMLEQTIETFRLLIAKPMDTIGERKQKTTNLVQLFAVLDNTIYDRLDKLMVLFKLSEPEFYSEYRTARNIIFNIENKKTVVQSIG